MLRRMAASNSFKNRRLMAMKFGVMLILLLAGMGMGVGVGVADDEECQGDPQALAEQCGPYVQKAGPRMDPSKGCCSVIRGTDIGCVCRHLPREIEQMLDMEKVVYVTGFCGKPLPHGSKCGSYTVPHEAD